MATATAKRPMSEGLARNDSRMRGSPLLEPGNIEPENRSVDYGRYYDPGYFTLEVERLWRRQWLLAGREEDLRAVGDRMPVDIGPLSFFIVKTGENDFKAFYNSCLHRGTLLCAKAESADSIRCPFHGWEWHNNGALKRIPGHWDYTDITRANGSLREVQLERWGGFLFINADPAARPLSDALHIIPDHFRDFAPERRFTVAHVRKLVPANWKIVQEAFMEGYHAAVTHPETIPFTSDGHTQYDVWSNGVGHVGRLWAASALANTEAGPEITPLYAAQAFLQSMCDWRYPNDDVPALDPDVDLRAEIAEWHRKTLERIHGRPFPLPDGLMLDSVLYFMFPHCVFFLTEFLPLVFSFTPHPRDPSLSYFEIRMLQPWPENASRSLKTPVVEMGVDDRLVDNKELAFSFVGLILDQDMNNMPLIQRGVRASDPALRHSHLGANQEMIIQYWNRLFDQCLARP
ncbi:MAG: Rieske (2Fe-2S) protein [Caulobacteraceae bacterium]|nr:Rieske (2Fe-2S) protein [Caulobacteraceae bacterium]